MSIYHYLYDAESQRIVNLGKKLDSDEAAWSGISINIGADRYRLPPEWLDALINRFRECHPNAQLLDEGELEAAIAPVEAANPDKDFLIEINGDDQLAVPVTDYLPQLADKTVLDTIASNTELRVSLRT